MAGDARGGSIVTPPVVRGSPSRIDEMMESFQEAYVRGVAAAAGCIIAGIPAIDEGVDLRLTHRADAHKMGDHTAHLEVQMKSSGKGPIEQGKFVTATLKRSRYDDFRATDLTINKIVVILHMPDDQEKWVKAGETALRLHHRAYWVNLQGLPPIENPDQQSITVRAPTSQIFDDLSLCRMMQRIGQWEKP
ncbi:DUF4365 domain-containing protein [Mycobacterium sp. Root135]|uniref:DUF4365 domain-containing protein n=1 Tax=Mycobacterium sp. Root135 TaxID=1736457 RepID=UPI0009E75D88|nr:DUF4365 domain-containing protein [Mycobacterium sp. Root135]